MGGSVVRLGLISLSPLIFVETISSDVAITCGGVAWFYLRLTLVIDACGLTLVLAIRGGLWLAECLDVTAVGQNLADETSPRTFVSDQRGQPSGSPAPRAIVVGSERYVACIVSFVGSKTSPFFHSRNVTAAIFRASVTLASSLSTPRLTDAW